MKTLKKLFLLIVVVLVSFLTACKKEGNNTPKLEEVTFSNMITSMTKGDVFVIEYSKQDNVASSFVSSNSSVAVVEQNKVTAVSIGSFTLKATFTLGEESKSYEFSIEVKGAEYSISYELDGGHLPASAPTKYSEGTKVTLPVPTKEGYEFLGWSKENGSSNYITEISVSSTGDFKVYANWNKLPVYKTITYVLDGGVNPNDAPTTYQVEVGCILPVPTKEGYEFLGWTLSETSNDYITHISVNEIGDVIVYAKWSKIPVYKTITYMLDGGTNPNDAPTSYQVEVGCILPIPTKVGYEFLGWTLSENSTDYVTEISASESNDVTIYAKWNKLPVYKTITYILDGGRNPSDAPKTYQVEVGCILPIPTKQGYEFLGWTLSESSTNYITEISTSETSNVVVYAKWSKIPVYSSITYVLDGGTNPSDVPTTYQEEVGVKLPTPTKEGYEFLGWTLSENSTSYINEISNKQTGNVTVYAKWSKIPVYGEITYNLAGGENPTGAPTRYEEGVGVTLPTPKKQGFKFLGWSLVEGSTEYIKVISNAQTGSVTVYANWIEYNEPQVGDPFTITYELNGGSWSWDAPTVTNAAAGIDSISNLPEIFMADFYTYLLENDLLNASVVSAKLHVSDWTGFSAKYGDPVAWYNATSTGGYSAADGYSELFFDSVNEYEAIGGFLGTSPYKEKYANLTKHAIQLTAARYSIATTSKNFKGAMGFVLDGYFYGTQGLLATSKANYEVFNALRATIPTPTVGYVGSVSSTNEYVVTSGVVGTPIKLVAPVREGHMLLGWYDNPECYGEKVTSVSTECTLYASWVSLSAPAPVHNINYVLNGGTNSSDAPKQFTFGEGAVLTKPSREGYTFTGWSTDPEGLDLINEIPAMTNSDFTVYANWVEGEDKVYTITYVYTDGKLPSNPASSIEEVAEYLFTSYYNWLKPSDSYETFKTKVIAQWKDKQAQGEYKFYKQNGKDTIDNEYFCNAEEYFEEWNAWFTVFDSLVTAANGAQNAWNSYVGILRLGQVLSGNAPTTWKAAFNTTLCEATQIKVPLVKEYKLGEEFNLVNLVINDGRTFLGWYDQNGNKIEKISSNTKGDLVLTAKWSESIPVESFEVTNKIDRLLKLSTHQLTWVIGPTNATFKKVTFASSNQNILVVNDKGLIEAISTGTAKVLITVHGNTALNLELEIEVYVDPYIDGRFIDESYVVEGESISLDATLISNTSDTLTWTSKTPNIATVSADGTVTGVNEGLAEIVVAGENNSNVSFTFYVTVINEEASGILKLLLDSNNAEIYTKDQLLIGIKIGSDGAYYSDIVGSVSKLLFEDYEVHDDYYLANPNNKSTYNGDGIGGIDFITVHYAADMPYSASALYNGGKNLASYNQSCNNGASSASWHYSVGNDGIWACQNEAYGAWHAGASKKMTWTDSGVTTTQVGTDLYTTDVTMGSDGYFYIKGVKTTIKNSSAGTKLNGMGLGVKVIGNKVYLGGHYQNTSYNYISSTGGNNNSIGMETSVREGSDLWLTWQYTAQLCAKLLIKYQLPLNRLVGHHFFSGKWCPQPMLEYDLEIWKEFVELTRQQMELYQNYSDCKLSFASSSPYLKDNGRVSSLPNYPECATYTVTYTVGNETKTITLSSILPGNLE